MYSQEKRITTSQKKILSHSTILYIFSVVYILFVFFFIYFSIVFFSYACANSKIIAQYTIKNQKKKNQTHSHHNSHIDDQGRDYYDGHSHNNDHAK